MEWTQVFGIRGMHRIFTTPDVPGVLAIADDSGRNPDQTDDGVLWLKPVLEIVLDGDGKGLFAQLPVTNRLTGLGERPSTVLVDAPVAAFLSVQWHVPLRLKTCGYRFNLTPAA